MSSGGRGHRALPHTADVILEAWGPDLEACLEEAVAALVGLYAEPGAPVVERRPVSLEAPGAEADAALLTVLDEVLLTLDTDDRVPVGAEVRAAGGATVQVTLLLADRATVRQRGSVPKAVARSGLVVDVEPGSARARFLVDV